jgi:hypothetical protein
MLLCLQLLLFVQSLLSFWKGSAPPQCPVTHFSQSNVSPDCFLCEFQLVSLSAASYNVSLLPRHGSYHLLHPLMLWCCCQLSCPSSDIAAALRFGSLCRCCIPGPSAVSSQLSVLHDHVPYTVQERHGRSSVCGRRPTSASTHYRPASVSSTVGALHLDSSPHISPPVLRQFPLQPLL